MLSQQGEARRSARFLLNMTGRKQLPEVQNSQMRSQIDTGSRWGEEALTRKAVACDWQQR